jgi:diguanylate cyclase (GGDEF)-like protein
METLATEDPLTGLANRRQFDRTILSEWQRARRSGAHLSLLLVNVDRFKAFNDLYGKLAGDNCLRSIAAIAVENSRRASDLVARFGGAEFAIILPETPSGGALEIAERLRSNVELCAMAHAGNPAGMVTVSVGCATMVPLNGASVTEFITAADAALYGAKRGGRNRVELVAV